MLKDMRIVAIFLFLLIQFSYAQAQAAQPLKVEALLTQSASMPVWGKVSVKVTNISNSIQEFNAAYCSPSATFITDNPLIIVNEGPGYGGSCYAVGNQFGKVKLKPSESKTFDFQVFGRRGLSKLGTFKLGFIHVMKDGKRDTSKEVIWSNSLTGNY
ncbi:MAG: hypothetical protein KGJ09_10480 [Candidatus Omnitrophica bacterium]|nr:hypothetical protein [Candidatus Omnitrophota bacterium]MDE2010482.1 hypothetical protein [Candidatus Omnitrophota bacterium]MDE2215485.1 hypothetical protein [Candidatus Omnitrophota bacterium]MDE2232289.1 hypothetical protein [Candidatus Omnitrophota bacterium]